MVYEKFILLVGINLLAVAFLCSLDEVFRRGVKARAVQAGALGVAILAGLMSFGDSSPTTNKSIAIVVSSILAGVSYLLAVFWGKGLIPRNVVLKWLPPALGSFLIILFSVFESRYVDMPFIASVMFLSASLALIFDLLREVKEESEGTIIFLFLLFSASVVSRMALLRPDLLTPLWTLKEIAIITTISFAVALVADKPRRVLMKKLKASITALREGRAPEPFPNTGGETRDLVEAVGTIIGAVRASHEELNNKLMELEERDRARQEFLQNISHELRTPLTGVIGNADLILALKQKELSSGKVLQDSRLQNEVGIISTIKEQAQHLLRIINDLIEFSRAESGQLKIFPRKTDVGQLVSQVCSSMLPYARRNNISLKCEKVECYAEVDPERMKQALFHVISNALKFTPKDGKVNVRVEFEEGNKTGIPRANWGTIKVKVQDTGMGIPQDKLDRFFSGFRQGDGSASREHGGLGIGLALIKAIVSAHGGFVDIQSTLGVGSVVTLTLPACEAPPKAPDLPEVIPQHLIIYYGDDQVTGELIRRMLAGTSVGVGLVFKREDLIKIAQENKPRVIVVSASKIAKEKNEWKQTVSTKPLNSIPRILMINDAGEAELDQSAIAVYLPLERESFLRVLKRSLAQTANEDVRHGKGQQVAGGKNGR